MDDYSNGLPVEPDPPTPMPIGGDIEAEAALLVSYLGFPLCSMTGPNGYECVMHVERLDEQEWLATLFAWIQIAMQRGILSPCIPLQDLLHHLDQVILGKRASVWTPW